MQNKILVSLEELNSYFEEPIYIVGGAVRNHFAGLEISDVDLAAAIRPEQIFERLAFSKFKVSETSKKLFTLKIRDGDLSYEFTSFRLDSYENGAHSPYEVKFTDDIEMDARRRDFTVNAIYYDIKNRKIIDPLSGMDDLKKKLIRAVSEPQTVFSQDGLRLMRLVRQAAELGFEIDARTFKGAEENVDLIKDIAAERIRDEFNKIIYADLKYGIINAHLRGMELADKLGLLYYILPELVRAKGVKQRKDFHKYDVYGHIMKAFEYSPKEVRLAALFHDIAKPISINPNGSMRGHEILGESVTREIMARLRYSNADTDYVAKLVKFHMYDLKCEAKESTLRGFIQDNFDIIEPLIALKRADYAASGIQQGDCLSATRMQNTFEVMKRENIPFTVKNLLVSGKDLIELDIPEEKRGIALSRLLKAALSGGEMLTKDCQIDFILKNIKNF